jgi:hypothetical protein
MKKLKLNHAYGSVIPLTPEMKLKCKDTGGSFKVLRNSVVLNISISSCVHTSDYRDELQTPPLASKSFFENAFLKIQNTFDILLTTRKAFVDLIGKNIEIQNRYGKPKIVKVLDVSNIYVNDSVYSSHPFVQGANGIDHLFFELQISK